MARTVSTMLALGTLLPEFEAVDFRGQKVAVHVKDKMPRLIIFMCSHCPFVVHLKKSLGEFSQKYLNKIKIVGINSNDLEKFPQDGLNAMAADTEEFGYRFPFVLDASQNIAKSMNAACTPDFFLFDQNGCLVYRGQYDDSRPGSTVPVTGFDLSQAVDALLSGNPVHPEQKASIGCNIKWR